LTSPSLWCVWKHARTVAQRSTDVSPTRRFGDRRYADNVGRFADTYNCIKTAFHDTDILAYGGLWWRCNCISGFLGDVTFSYNGPYGGVTLQQQNRCSVVHGLSPPSRRIGCVQSYIRRQAPRLDESFVLWYRGLSIYMRCIIALFIVFPARRSSRISWPI